MIGLELPFSARWLLQVKAACARHAHVEDQAAGAIQYVGVKQFSGRGKTGRLETRRQDQLGQRLANGCVVIDDNDERLVLFITALQ